MSKVRYKLPEHDKGGVIEDDVWIGSNAIILHGVTIKRGSVIGAGSVVTKSTEPYSISVGNPARILRYRFSKEQILMHEEILYPADERLTSEQIDTFIT
jgi:acetyltransferase-like isoleucine patch superfamily enzyme